MNELGLVIGRQTLGVLGHREPQTFTLLDREWEKFGEVFGGGDYLEPTGWFTSLLPFEGCRRFLEMGCGAGVTAVMAALSGVPEVTACDINPAAARNAAANAERHGVGDRVRALESDLFAAVPAGETFDLIFWNSPFIEGPEGTPASYEEYAVFDPGYAMHRAFFAEAPSRLTETGRVFLGFSTAVGDLDRLLSFGHAAGLAGRVAEQLVTEVPHAAMGTDPAFAAHADDAGNLHLDLTLLEFRRE
ncbi:methyltransferase [Actinomadura flavalba]|uniref:methyltransferase n=1 Tax=Actinomadura flavalba TaxID=1120938 RepID=UPI00037C732F|nr:methyltransferase [Actinomadura flavalba]